MGGGSSKFVKATVTGGKKKVVIVGGSFGGKLMVQHLQALDPKEEQFEILIVDKQSHFEFICSNYKVLCEEETFKKHAVDFKTGLSGYGSKRVSFQQGKLTSVNQSANSIEVQDAQGQTSTINYDCLVIVTGASMVGPWRANDDTMPTMEERDAEVKEFREKCKAAKSILCIGAGATGIESASYLKETWPDKTVGICQRGDVMMPDVAGAHPIVEDYMVKKLGVVYHHNTGFKDGEGIANDYEVHVDCRGFKFNGPRNYMTSEMAECVDKKTGQIWVNQYCQVTNKHPIAGNHNPSTVETYKNIFSIGDVCLTPANEVKSIVSIYQYIGQAAWNVQQVLGNGSSFKPIPAGPSFHSLVFIPMGKKGGVQCMNNMVSFKADVPKAKDDIMVETMGFFRGDKKIIKEVNKKTHEVMPMMFGVLEGNCSCLPPHISKIKAKNEANFDKNKQMFEKLYTV